MSRLACDHLAWSDHVIRRSVGIYCTTVRCVNRFVYGQPAQTIEQTTSVQSPEGAIAMQPTQPITQTAVASPWKDKELSYGTKLGLTFVCALLLIILIVSLLVVIGVSGELAMGRTAPQNVTFNLIAVGAAAALLVGS